MDQQGQTNKEEFTISGDEVVAKIRQLINEGNVRKVIIRTEEGRTLLEVPLTTASAVGAAAVLFAPVLAAIGALAALAAKLTIVIERTGQSQSSQPQSQSQSPQIQSQGSQTQPMSQQETNGNQDQGYQG
jgi:hypothetical protein